MQMQSQGGGKQSLRISLFFFFLFIFSTSHKKGDVILKLLEWFSGLPYEGFFLLGEIT